MTEPRPQLFHLLQAEADCPTVLNDPQQIENSAPVTPEQEAHMDLEPLPEQGNLIGFLLIARKAEIELSSGSEVEVAAIMSRFNSLQTKGDATRYITEIMSRVAAAQVKTEKLTQACH